MRDREVKIMMTFICDYATISPIILCNKIIAGTTAMMWATYNDIDEDCFNLTVFNPLEGEELSEEDKAWLEIVMEPYLYRED